MKGQGVGPRGGASPVLNFVKYPQGRKHNGHCTECNGTIGQIATTGPIWYPGLDRIPLTKPNQENRIYRLRRSVPVISFPEKCAGANLEATLYQNKRC